MQVDIPRRMAKTITHKRLVGLGDLARALDISASWLLEETKQGNIPHLKVAGRFLYSVEAVEQVLLERAAKGGGRPHAE